MSNAYNTLEKKDNSSEQKNHVSLYHISTSFFSLSFIFKNNILVNINSENELSNIKIGNIFLSKIIEKNPSLGVYFVDIGMDKKALLKINQKNSNFFIGQKIIVQIIKEEIIPNKSAVVTDDIVFEGALVRYKPFGKQIIFSKKLSDDDKEKLTLEFVNNENKLSDEGIVIRSLYKHNYFIKLQEELNVFRNLYKDISQINKIGLLHTRPTLEKLLINNHKLVPNEIIIDNILDLNNTKELLKKYNFLDIKLHINTEKENLYQKLELQSYLDEISSSVLQLNPNISLIFYHTEAFNYIDVDFKGTSDLTSTKENSFYQTNLEIIPYIINQIILRNLSGQILIDLLKINKKLYKNNIIKKTQDIFNKDLNKSSVLGFSNLGILEIARQKTKESIVSVIKSNLFQIFKLFLDITNIINKNPLSRITVEVPENLFFYLKDLQINDFDIINTKLIQPINFVSTKHCSNINIITN